VFHSLSSISSLFFLNPSPALLLNNKGRVKTLLCIKLLPLPLDLREGVGGWVKKLNYKTFFFFLKAK
jgi:hypothetical protein